MTNTIAQQQHEEKIMRFCAKTLAELVGIISNEMRCLCQKTNFPQIFERGS
jgi:hypothetical protein